MVLVLVNNQIGIPCSTTVGVRQGCLLYPVLFNIFVDKIMQDTLKYHDSTISIGGRHISNLRFADDIDLIADLSNELQNIKDSLAKHASIYGMEISHEKSNILVNDPDPNKCNPSKQ